MGEQNKLKLDLELELGVNMSNDFVRAFNAKALAEGHVAQSARNLTTFDSLRISQE